MSNISVKKTMNYMGLLFIFCLGLVGALLTVYGISFLSKTTNMFLLEYQGFNFIGNSVRIIDPSFMGFISVFSILIGCFFMFCMGKFIDEAWKQHLKKYIKAMPIAMALFAIFVVDFSNKEETLMDASQRFYSKISEKYEDKSVFTNSTPAKDFQLAMETKNNEVLKDYINNPNKIKGLDEADMFNKLLTVQNISNKSVRDEFTVIYADRYITQDEYTTFKKNAMNSIMNNLTTDVIVDSTHDKNLITNL